MTNIKSGKGFSLVELMIVVAIVGAVAAIAIPSYTESVQEGRRTDATTSLMSLHLQQERYRTTNSSYATQLSDIWPSSTTEDGFYNLSMSSSDSYVSNFKITATPVSGGPQDGDGCGNFVLTQDGPDYSAGADRRCWRQ